MSNSDRRSLLDRFVAGCFGLLLAAAALYVAVQLLKAIALFLIVLTAIGLLTSGLVFVWRRRTRGW